MWKWFKKKPLKGIGVIIAAWIAIVLLANFASFIGGLIFNPIGMILFLVALFFAAKYFNDRKGGVARGIVSFTGGMAKRIREKQR